MKSFGKIVGGGLKMLGVIKKPKAPKESAAMPPAAARRDEIRDDADRLDELRRRKGGLADIMTGSGGAEAGGGKRSQLG